MFCYNIYLDVIEQFSLNTWNFIKLFEKIT
jgi:hypothetical protein